MNLQPHQPPSGIPWQRNQLPIIKIKPNAECKPVTTSRRRSVESAIPAEADCNRKGVEGDRLQPKLGTCRYQPVVAVTQQQILGLCKRAARAGVEGAIQVFEVDKTDLGIDRSRP